MIQALQAQTQATVEPGDPPTPPLLTLVVPCFNEAHRLATTFHGIRTVIGALPYPVEILLVDDGSSDDTVRLAMDMGATVPGFHLLREPHRGKGGALRAGVLVARGEYIFLADADWSMPPEQVLSFLPPALTDFDIAIASREVQGAVRHGEPLRRHLLGRAFNRLVQMAVLPGIEDSQCGFKCLRRDAGILLFEQGASEGWAFDVELLLLARHLGLRIKEIPIDWHYRADSRLRPVRDGLTMGADVLKLALRQRLSGGYQQSDLKRGERMSDPQASMDCHGES
jgi:glycosyltransferase involved in cell wall biosynthesis